MQTTDTLILEYQEPEQYPTKLAYAVDQTTREYIGETVADPSPLEPGVWLLPAHAYYEEPPRAGVNEKAVMTDAGWFLSPDFRGDWYSKVDGSVVTFRELGPLPENLTGVVCPGPHYKWVSNGWVLDTVEESGALAAQASATRDGLLSTAAIRIAPLQDAVDLEEATPADIALLKKWKKYRVDLNRIDQQQGYPNQIEWPVVPG